MTWLHVSNARCAALFVSGLQRSGAPADDAVAAARLSTRAGCHGAAGRQEARDERDV